MDYTVQSMSLGMCVASVSLRESDHESVDTTLVWTASTFDMPTYIHPNQACEDGASATGDWGRSVNGE